MRVKLMGVTRSVRPAPENLSPREVDVLDYLVKGFSYKETAEAMGISYGTVHTHIEHIYHKLHVRSRAQAVARYLRVWTCVFSRQPGSHAVPIGSFADYHKLLLRVTVLR